MITLIQIIGLIGVAISVVIGFLVAGGNLHSLDHAAPCYMVTGIVFFGLAANFRVEFMNYIPEALKAIFIKPNESKKYKAISDAGRRYAIGAGMVTFVLQVLVVLSSIAKGPEVVGRGTASALTAVVLTVVVAEVLFTYLSFSFSKQDSELTFSGKIMSGVFVLLFVYVLYSNFTVIVGAFG